MAEERPFSVAVLFGVVWVVLAYLAGVLVLPLWSYLNIGLCSLAVLLCVMNYVNEYLGKFPLDYRYEVKMKIRDRSFIYVLGGGRGWLNYRIPCHSKTHLESVATRLRSYTARMLSGYVATELHSCAA